MFTHSLTPSLTPSLYARAARYARYARQMGLILKWSEMSEKTKHLMSCTR